MKTNISKFRAELKELINKGEMLYVVLAAELGLLNEEQKILAQECNINNFKEQYQAWYSLSHNVIKQIIPDRLSDFVKQYKDEKRKQLDFTTYGMSDYLIGVVRRHGTMTIVDGKSAHPKLEQQLYILKSAETCIDNILNNMTEIMQADLFDDELDSATELQNKGFTRAAGAIAGVVLERHLAHICDKHSCVPKKKNPAINDLNQSLRDANTIDIPTWRFIQHLADIRNICDHSKGEEPSKENVEDLIKGVAKIIKTVF